MSGFHRQTTPSNQSDTDATAVGGEIYGFPASSVPAWVGKFIALFGLVQLVASFRVRSFVRSFWVNEF